MFGIGPAGTGKTYLAVAKAVQALQAKEVNRIILTRPAVEAGEKLGFLPGTLYDKIDPYLRPLYDALHDMLDPESIPRLMAAGTIEVAPLAYMRGRTLNDAFIILDEAQNTSPEQMKMFLTRLGFGSKVVVTGDITQVDLPNGTQSGLRVVREILEGLEDVHFSDARPRPTSCGTSWSARSSTPTRASTTRTTPAGPRSPPAGRGGRRVGRDRQRVRAREVDEVRLAELARFVLDAMGVHPQAELSVLLVDVDHMTRLHVEHMGEPGPTDVLAFEQDDLQAVTSPARHRPGGARRCSATSCSARRSPRAQGGEAGHGTEAELHLLCTHGVLHLLGYDHAEPEEAAEMFGRAGASCSGAWADAPGHPVSGTDLLLVAVAAVLVLIAALLASAEAALARVSRVRVEEMGARSASRRRRAAHGAGRPGALPQPAAAAAQGRRRAHRHRAGGRWSSVDAFGGRWPAAVGVTALVMVPVATSWSGWPRAPSGCSRRRRWRCAPPASRSC